MLANDSNNENFCLGFACVDGGDDGNSGGGDGDEHHHSQQAGRAEDQTNRQADRLGRGLSGAERR
jgi:hypothetical protein